MITTLHWGGMAKCRGPKTIVASWHCHPESFCASGKFLRVTHLHWEVSTPSGKFPDRQDGRERFQIAWKFSG